MTIGQRIRSRRKELNLTMKDIFERENIKTGNLSELENDKYLPAVQTLIALGRVLECSIDWLLTGSEYQVAPPPDLDFRALKTEQGLACDGLPISEEEADLIAMYRLLPEEQREDIFDVTHLKYKKHVERKKESIYWTYAADREEKSDPGEDESTSGIA